jgi:colicin import membrane protein
VADKAAKQKEAADKAAADKLALEQAAKDKAEADRIAREKEEAEKKEGIVVKDIDPVTNKPGDPDVDAKHRIANTLGADKYKETIKKADGYFKMKRWAEAKTAYEEALKLKNGDPYSTGKLAEVEKLSAPK